MENKNLSLPCEIVKDLLPLYHDKIVNEVTACTVKDHLDNCNACMEEYEKICRELPEKLTAPPTPKTTFKSWKEKMKNHHRHLTISIALISCIAVVALVLKLCHDPLIPVKPRNLEITEIYMVEDRNGEPVIFLAYDQSSSYYTHTGDVNIITMRNGRTTLTIKSKVSLLEFLNPTPADNTESHIVTYYMKNTTDIDALQEIYYEENVVWTKAQNDTSVIPPYVYIIADLLNKDDETYFTWDTDSWGNDSRTIVYGTGKSLTWNLEGEVIGEDYEPEADDKYFNGTVHMIQDNELLIIPDSTSRLSNSANILFVSLDTLKKTSAEQLRNLKTDTQVRIRYHAPMDRNDCTISDADRLAIGWSFDELE